MRLILIAVMTLAAGSACSSSDDTSAEQSADPTTLTSTTLTSTTLTSTTDPAADQGTASTEQAAASVTDSSAASSAPSTSAPDVAGGTVTIDEAIWSFEAEICTAEGGLRAAGVGADEDGNPAWVDVSVDTSVDFDGDGVLDSSATVVVGVGRTNAESEPVSGRPDWYATTTQTGEMSLRQFDYVLEGGHLTGSGTIRDYDVEEPEPEPEPEPVLAELAFDVSCP